MHFVLDHQTDMIVKYRKTFSLKLHPNFPIVFVFISLWIIRFAYPEDNDTDYELDYDSDNESDYGKDWLYFIDDNATEHIMNFSSVPSSTRGFILGDVYFYLYTRENVNNPELICVPSKDDTPIKMEYFKAASALKVITHGWLSSGFTEWLLNMKNLLLSKGDFNVIAVDWNEVAQNPAYPWAAFSTKYVGKRVAKLLNAVMSTYSVDGSSIHLIGHSLGAHVMGYAGSFSKDDVYRITGLDPAKPLFELPPMGPSYILDKSDAVFVDIIHTCGGVLGYKHSHGDADFYPNHGTPPQPGCEGLQKAFDSCSHGRSHEYFSESINSPIGFKSHSCQCANSNDSEQCINGVYMGYPADKNRTGDYCLSTKSTSPYALE